MRPFHFLADLSSVVTGPELTERARRAEQLGYHGVAMPDHLVEQLSPIICMASVAAVTSTLRVGAFVLNNDLRHPAVLAQELASLDVLSGGRVDVAVGAGWNRPEYDAIGLPFERTRVRQARLAESIAVLKGCFAGAPFTFAGEHYAITEYTGQPAPVQRPHPPFFIGGGGRRTLELAAREADVVGLAPRIGPGAKVDPASLTLAAAREKIDWVRAAAGERFDGIELNAYPSGWPPVITNDVHAEARKVIDHLRARTGHELSEQDVLDSPHVFIGSVDRLVEKFLHLREELGITSFLLGRYGELEPVLERLSGQ